MALLASPRLLGFAPNSAYEPGQARQTALTAELTGRPEATASTVRQQPRAAVGCPSAPATSETAIRDDVPGLCAPAQRVAFAHTEVRAVSLAARDRRLLFLTLVALGTRGLFANDPEALHAVFATGRPAASGAFAFPDSESVVITAGLPVLRDGHVVYCLRMALLTDTLGRLVAAQRPPPGWAATVIDARGKAVAHS